MTRCVLDGSVALAWVLPGEGAPAIDALLDDVTRQGALAPGLWPLETGNVLLMAERRGRITAAECRQALALLKALPINIDAETPIRACSETMALAAARGLTLYDASYLELALRHALPLASLDAALRAAAIASGVEVLPAV